MGLYESYQTYKEMLYLYRNKQNMSPEKARELALRILDGKKEVIKK